MEDDRGRVGSIGAWRPRGTSRRKQKELCPSDLSLVEPLAQELVLDGLKGSKVAADWGRDESGEKLDLFLGKDRLQWDTACGGSIVGKNTRFRFHTCKVPLSSAPGVADGNTENDVLHCYLLLGKGGIDPHLICFVGKGNVDET